MTFLKVVLYTMLALDLAGQWFVSAWWPYRHGGQTPAMRWLRLRVVTTDGGHPPLGAFVARELLMVVDRFAWGLAGIVVMLVSGRRQRFGDIVARTLVVRVPRSADQPAFPGPDGDFGAVADPQLAFDRADVGLDRGHRHHERVADLLVGLTARHGPHDVGFPGGERVFRDVGTPGAAACEVLPAAAS